MQVQQLEVKLFVDDATASALDVDALIPIFHSWIRDSKFGSEVQLIDVADYRHVVHGPSVMLIGVAGQWRLDLARGEMGLTYAAKRDELGPVADKTKDGFRWVLRAAELLQKEQSVAVNVRTDEARVTVMSRLCAGNDDADYGRFTEAANDTLASLFGGSVVTTRVEADPRAPLEISVRPQSPPAFDAMLGVVGKARVALKMA